MEERRNILIVEADPVFSAHLKGKVEAIGKPHCVAGIPEMEIEALESLAPALAILGTSLGRETSLRWNNRLKIIDPGMPVLIFQDDVPAEVPSHGLPFEGIYPLFSGADLEALPRTVERALAERGELPPGADLPVLVGESDGIQAVRQAVRRMADKDATVLITGETGTGKDLIARSIHYHSRRRERAIVKIGCGNLPEDLLESEVFGFQRGAFTDAYRDKPGRFELANGGTLFIDEIGDLPLSMQAKFLQVMEDKAFSRLGDTKDKSIDARVVAATNKDLRLKVSEGTFRKDLFYRLNVLCIQVPPLRERKEDIPVLVRYFIDKYRFHLKKEVGSLPPGVIDLFSKRSWPGNVRELENLIRRGIVLKNWDFLLDELAGEASSLDEAGGCLPESASPDEPRPDQEVGEYFKDKRYSLKEIIKTHSDKVERRAIMEALDAVGWNRTRAIQRLGITYRTLLNRIAALGIRPPKGSE